MNHFLEAENKILNKAMQGCALRTLYILGSNNLANEIVNENEAEVVLIMELTNFIEEHIREGLSIAESVTAALEAGYLEKINNFKD
jgi:hypothetical protein